MYRCNGFCRKTEYSYPCHRRNYCGYRKLRHRNQLHSRTGCYRRIAWCSARNKGYRQRDRRADCENRFAGHERRSLADTCQENQRAAETSGYRRNRYHSRNGHHGRNCLLPEPDCQEWQTCRAGRCHASVYRAKCRRPVESLQCRSHCRRQGI